jgi:hypothetical protein
VTLDAHNVYYVKCAKQTSRGDARWLKGGYDAHFPGFGAVSGTLLIGDFLSGCLVLFASLFMVFEVEIGVEAHLKGKK